MVYDEGIEFNLGDKNKNKDKGNYLSYFLFLKFSDNINRFNKIRTKYLSHCNEALIGWYHINNEEWGCFYGHKLIENYNLPTNGEASDKKIVLENIVKLVQPSLNFMEIQKNLNKNKTNKKIFDINKEKKEDRNNEKNKTIIMKKFNLERFMQIKTKFNTNNKSNYSIKNENENENENAGLLNLSSEFTNHEEVVERINSMNLSWKAEVYSELKGKTISEMNNFYGKMKLKKSKSLSEILDSNSMNSFKPNNLKNNKDKNKKTQKSKNFISLI
jgi:hypothetical protein